MDTPSVVFYEHSFDDTMIQSLSKNVLNLGNECRALAEENARLKAEVERLRKAGDAMAKVIDADATAWFERVVRDWNAAKEGKPSV